MKDILSLLKKDLDEVEKELRQLANGSLPLLDNINQYLHSSGGKRLRPAVLLLCSRLLGYQGRAAYKLGGVVELIHVATLVHDDIIDNADVRRGRVSVNARWGNQITVLAGDWMYMTAFYIALELQNFAVLDLLIDITRTMVEGELIQLEKNGRLDISRRQQMEISVRKTACLFSGCTRLAALVSEQDQEVEKKLGLYGQSLGIAFQLIDDLLDYTSNESILGKPALKDLEEGKITLPIILLMEQASSPDRDFVEGVVRDRAFSADNKSRIIDLVKSYGTLSQVRQLAESYGRKAAECMTSFPDSVYRDALVSLPDLVINRVK